MMVKTNAGPPAGQECSFTGVGKNRGPKTSDVQHQGISWRRQIAAAPTKMLIEGSALQTQTGRPVFAQDPTNDLCGDPSIRRRQTTAPR